MRMFLTFAVLIFFSSLGSAQENKTDTVRLHLYDLHKPSYFIYDDFEMEYRLPGSLPTTKAEPGNIKLYTSYILSTGSGDFEFQTAPHLLSNYLDFYIENSRFNPLKQILGIAQLSATGYLAYRHIKKYGFK